MRFATCLLAAVIVTTAACAKAPDERARQYIADGDRFADAGKYGEAAIQYRNAIKLAPASVVAHEKLAQVAMLGREPAVAADALLRVAELKPDDPGAQLRAASIYLLSGRYEESRARAEAVIKADDTNANAHLVLGEALAALHEQTQSEASLQAAVRLAPALPAPHVALASAYWSAGRVAEAEAEVRKAVELDPIGVRANRALAMLLMATGRGRDAEGSWAAVADAPSGLPFALADYFAAMNRTAEAEQALASLAAQPATRDAARVRLAAVQFTRGRRAEAHQTIQAVLLDSPHFVPALLLEARLFEAEHRLDDALRAARQAVADDPARL
jgi:tetratricopeptide (TPR) repeat protein